jgi:CRP-like cAMP-binding protein
MGTLPSKKNHIRRFLTQSTFLGRLPGGVIDDLLEKGQLLRLANGAIAYRRGDAGDRLMVLTKGRIKLTATNVDGKEVVLHYVGVGDIFGEIAALDGKEYAADAIAMEDSEVFAVGTRDLLPTLIAHPDAMLNVLQALCEKIRAGATIIEDRTLEMRRRMARGLLRLARQQGQTKAASAQLQLKISQEELGKYVGMSRENVNRQLRELKIANVIGTKGTEITITHQRRLVEIARVPSTTER